MVGTIKIDSQTIWYHEEMYSRDIDIPLLYNMIREWEPDPPSIIIEIGTWIYSLSENTNEKNDFSWKISAWKGLNEYKEGNGEHTYGDEWTTTELRSM
jgi:hypothetical protein